MYACTYSGIILLWISESKNLWKGKEKLHSAKGILKQLNLC